MITLDHDGLLVLMRTSLCTSLAAGLAWLLLTKLRVASPRVHRLAWLLVVLQGWLLIPLTIEVETLAKPPIDPDLVMAVGPASGDNEFGKTIPADQAAASGGDHAGSWWLLGLGAVWITGALFVAGRHIKQYLTLASRLPLGAAPTDPTWLDEWRRVLGAWNVARPVQLRMTESDGPLLCFIPFTYLVLAPTRLWRRLEGRQREAILKHEAAHLVRGDLWKSAAVRLLALPQWFNPCVWWAVKKFDEAGEWACDDLVVGQQKESDVSYPGALLKAAEWSLGSPPGAVAAGGGVLSRRIKRLVNPCFTEERMMIKLIAPLCLAALAALQLVRIEAVAAEEESPAPATREERLVQPAEQQNSLTQAAREEPQVDEKVVYIVYHGLSEGDFVARVPCKPGVTAASALQSSPAPRPINFLSVNLWIDRPSPRGAKSNQIIPIDWNATDPNHADSKQVPLQPGDRVFVTPRGEAAPSRQATLAAAEAVQSRERAGRAVQPTPYYYDRYTAPRNPNRREPAVKLSIQIIRDADGAMLEFEPLRKGVMQSDSATALGSIRLLEKHNLIDVLAAPALTCNSGQQATVMIGSESAVEQESPADDVNGFQIEAVPDVLDDGSIRVALKTRISLDGQTQRLETQLLFEQGVTWILRTSPSLEKDAASRKNRTATYIAITPQLLR